MFIKVRTRNKGDKVYKYAELVESLREGNKISHRRILYFGVVDDETISKLKLLYDKNALVVDSNTINCESSVPYGNFLIINAVIEKLELVDKFKNLFTNIVDKNGKPYITLNTAVLYIKAMIMQRIIRPESKLSLIEWQDNTPLKHFTGLEKLDLQTAYRSLDVLEKNIEVVEKNLYNWAIKYYNQTEKELFYDITSTYFDGHSCIIANYGYSRDHRGDKVQVVIGVVTTSDGFPIKCEVYKGNTTDKTTVCDVVNKLKSEFNIQEVVFVGDRGMLTEKNITAIKDIEQNFVMAIPRAWSKKYLENINISEDNMTLIKEALYFKIIDTDLTTDKLLLCLNIEKRTDDTEYRTRQINKIESKLKEINKSLEKARKPRTSEELMKKIGSVLKKNPSGKYFIVNLEETENKAGFTINYVLNDKKISADKWLDGTFLIRTNKMEYSESKLLETYKNLRKVENAFKVIKNNLDIRPVFHWKERRVKAHIYLCVLSYFIFNAIEYTSKSLRTKMTAVTVLNTLESLSLIKLNLDDKLKKYIFTDINSSQKEILNLFNIKNLTTQNLYL